MFKRLSLRFRVFLLFAMLAGGSIAALVAGLFYGFQKEGESDSLNALLIGGTMAGFMIAGLTAWVWLMFDENVAKPIERLAAALRTRTHAPVGNGLDLASTRYLGDLGPSAQDMVRELNDSRSALARSASIQTAGLAYEKALLETLLTDIPAGVLMCSASHQLVFYNVGAATLIGGLDADATPGLNRSLFEYLHPDPIKAAYARLLSTGDQDAASDILCATQAGGIALLARMRLLPSHKEEITPGYMLTLHNNATLALQCWEHPDLPGLDKAWAVHASDLANVIQARLNAKGLSLRYSAANLILRCNGFQLVALIDAWARHVAKQEPGLYLEISPDGAGALIRLEWNGEAVSEHELQELMALDLDLHPPGSTAQAVLAGHGARALPYHRSTGRSGLCVNIGEARLAQARAPAISHAPVYDFELLFKDTGAQLYDTRIEDLTYVVFDTETTGLYPEQGDKIIQIAAVRIVNRHRVHKEVFNTLVNPGRSIPLSSTRVHGITSSMCMAAPPMDTVARKFHQFVKGAVLVAHNAPFDMAFLRQEEATTGCRFDNPILDTVLLSAVVFGQSDNHSLDAVSHRLGITITEEDRHTALGDATATAEVFLKLLPALRARGLETLGDVVSEVRKQRRILKDLNE